MASKNFLELLNDFIHGGPTAPFVPVELTATQTLTNKTLTAPVLTAPVITGALKTATTVELTATKLVLAAESGTTFFLNSATEFATTLPSPAAGLEYSFIVEAAPSGASYTIGAGSAIVHGAVFSKDLNSATDTAGTAGTPITTITLVDSKAQVGDRVDVISDGTRWHARCFTSGNFDAISFS